MGRWRWLENQKRERGHRQGSAVEVEVAEQRGLATGRVERRSRCGAVVAMEWECRPAESGETSHRVAVGRAEIGVDHELAAGVGMDRSRLPVAGRAVHEERVGDSADARVDHAVERDNLRHSQNARILSHDFFGLVHRFVKRLGWHAAHASHVVMAVTKYMSRIVAPADLDLDKKDEQNVDRKAAALHDHTYGITSDALTQFACVFAGKSSRTLAQIFGRTQQNTHLVAIHSCLLPQH